MTIHGHTNPYKRFYHLIPSLKFHYTRHHAYIPIPTIPISHSCTLEPCVPHHIRILNAFIPSTSSYPSPSIHFIPITLHITIPIFPHCRYFHPPLNPLPLSPPTTHSTKDIHIFHIHSCLSPPMSSFFFIYQFLTHLHKNGGAGIWRVGRSLKQMEGFNMHGGEYGG